MQGGSRRTMTFKACKYCNVTQIQWDTELSAFREQDGKLHDRKRCEGIRNGGPSAASSPSQPAVQQQQGTIVSGQASYDTAHTLNELKERVTIVVQKLELLSEFYEGLLEQMRLSSKQQAYIQDQLRRIVSAQDSNYKEADAELAYDIDREEGLPPNV